MPGTLEKLLVRIRDGVATQDEVSQARELAKFDARLPEDVRVRFSETADADELVADAVGLLAVLGADDLFGDAGAPGIELDLSDGIMGQLAEEGKDDWTLGPDLAAAVRWEAGSVDIAGAVLGAVAAQDEHLDAALLTAALRYEAGDIDVSRGVLAELEVDAPQSIADAVHFEAGSVELAEAVLLAATGDAATPIAAAVAREAGDVDVASAVLAELGATAAVDVSAAIASESGEIDLSGAILQTLGHEPGLLVAEAIASEAGDIDIAASVLATIDDSRQAAPIPLPTAIPTPAAVRPLPAPANQQSWTWSALVMAAIILIVVGAGQLYPLSSNDGALAALPMEFASAQEIVVEDLTVADSVHIMQVEGDEGAMIVWIDDEALL